MTKPKKPPKVIKQPIIIVHTDGSALSNPGPGGYGAVIRMEDGEKITLSEGYYKTTNNRMEIMGVIAVLEEFGPGQHFEITTDSQYVINGSTKWIAGWIRNNWITFKDQTPVKNKDLWMIMNELLKANKVKFHWVRGHTGVADNEEADRLASAAAHNPTLHDTEYSGVS